MEICSPMDSMDEIGSDRRSVKRPAGDWESEWPVSKKVRNVKEVAEMVLVLASMGKIRGARVPTAAEKEIVAEARVRLAQLCLKFAPKDVFPIRDSFGGVIEDLGLNRLKEQGLGFRPPKMSIAHKLLFTKRKMEKAEEFLLPSASYSSQRFHIPVGATSGSNVKRFPPDKPSHAVNSSGTPVTSASLRYQLPTSEVRPLITGRVVPGNLVKGSSVALPGVGSPCCKMDARLSGSSHTLQVQATTGNHSTVRAPTWSVQPASVSVANKVTPPATVKVEGNADVRSTMAPKFTISRVSRSRSIHLEIGKTVQKFLQSLLPGQPTWVAPSRDYIDKALTCQMCKSTINEVDNVLVCDGCEKGHHLKCLQTNQRSVPREEWYCERCLSISNGKLIPPKDCHVMRNINASKMPKIANNLNHLPSGPKMENDRRIGGGCYVSIKENAEGEVSSAACSTNSSSNVCKREDQGIDWIGNALQVANEKHYYHSCCNNGFIYNVHEYALIRFEDERLIPSKLLAMWEDVKAGKKWVTVNCCYFPRDLPQAVGRPCSLESNEVYLSNCSTTVRAGQIQGLCEVLPPSKFNEERERRSCLETRPNGGLRPLYACKWIYDESKGLFRDITC